MLEFWYKVEELPLSMHIGETWWFPLLESVHVLGAVLVLGSLLMIDLRLMGLAARTYPPRILLSEFLPWTWAAFVVAVLTGLALFITRASGYAYNTPFIIKMLLLLAAGVNMAAFHAYSRRLSLNSRAALPLAAKIFGASSLLLWVGVMLAGRWIGHSV